MGGSTGQRGSTLDHGHRHRIIGTLVRGDHERVATHEKDSVSSAAQHGQSPAGGTKSEEDEQQEWQGDQCGPQSQYEVGAHGNRHPSQHAT